MRCSWCALGPILVVLIFLSPASSGSATAQAANPALVISDPVERANIFARDGGHDHHSSHDTPKLELNETEIEMYHGKTPPSYYTMDWDDADSKSRYPGLMIAHGLFMSLAFFGALPIGEFAHGLAYKLIVADYTSSFTGIAMRSVQHSAHGIAVLSFYGLWFLGCATSSLYTKLTPNLCVMSRPTIFLPLNSS